MAKKTVNLFVYGTLKEGYHNHHFLGDSKKIANYQLEGFRLIDLEAFPGMVPGKGYVMGELYEVNEDLLPELDRLEGVPYLYTREVSGNVWYYQYASIYKKHQIMDKDSW